MLQSIESILDVNTDVYHIPARSQVGKKVLLFLIAGNPGTIEFYRSFLEELSEQLNSVDVESNVHYDIYCPGHALHHLNSDSRCNFQTKGLDFQIEHKIAFITNVLKSTRFDGEIILVGHSIGSFMVLDIISKNVLIKKHTRNISLLMPFIFWDNIPLSHRLKLSAFTLNQPLQLLLTGLIQLIRFSVFDIVPRTLLTAVIKTVFTTVSCDADYEYIADILCNRLFTHRLVGNFLHMGGDEIRQVPAQQKRMLTILQKLDCDNKHIYHSNSKCINLHILYTDNDEWAPSQDIEKLQSTFSVNKSFTDIHHSVEPRVSYIEGLGHTYTMKKSSISKVVDELVVAFTGVKVQRVGTDANKAKSVDEERTTNRRSSKVMWILACSVLGCVGIDVGCRLLLK